MKVFLTGITGFVGGHLAQVLLKHGDRVAALIRSENKEGSRYWSGKGVQVVTGSLENPASWKDSLDDVDAVIHSAAMLSNQEHLPYSDFYSVNVEGTKHLLEAACLKNPQALFVYISTVSVLGPTPRSGADEDAPYGSCLSKYSRSKQEAERWLSSKRDANWVIVRPAQLYGEGMVYGWPQTLQKIRSGAFQIFGDGTPHLHLTHISDVVDGILRVLDAGQDVHHKIYHLAGPSAPTIADIFDGLAKILNTQRPGRLPYFVGEAAAKVLSFIPAGVKPQPLRLLHPQTIRYFKMNHVYSVEKAKKDLGFAPKVFYTEGLKRLVEWWISHEKKPH